MQSDDCKLPNYKTNDGRKKPEINILVLKSREQGRTVATQCRKNVGNEKFTKNSVAKLCNPTLERRTHR